MNGLVSTWYGLPSWKSQIRLFIFFELVHRRKELITALLFRDNNYIFCYQLKMDHFSLRSIIWCIHHPAGTGAKFLLIVSKNYFHRSLILAKISNSNFFWRTELEYGSIYVKCNRDYGWLRLLVDQEISFYAMNIVSHKLAPTLG